MTLTVVIVCISCRVPQVLVLDTCIPFQWINPLSWKVVVVANIVVTPINFEFALVGNP